jgi:hypothetical protein
MGKDEKYKDNYFYFYRNKNLSSVIAGYLTRVDLAI